MTKTQITVALTVAALAWDYSIARHNRRVIHNLQEERNNARNLANLYARMLNDHHIKPDAFETIIMNDLTK